MIGRKKNIPRMWIGVKKSLDQNLVEVGAKKLFGQHLAIELHPRQRTHLGDLNAGHVFHREHSRRTVIRDRRRHEKVWKLLELIAKGLQVVRFLSVIEPAH